MLNQTRQEERRWGNAPTSLNAAAAGTDDRGSGQHRPENLNAVSLHVTHYKMG